MTDEPGETACGKLQVCQRRTKGEFLSESGPEQPVTRNWPGEDEPALKQGALGTRPAKPIRFP